MTKENQNYLDEPQKVSNALQGGLTYFRGNSLGDTSVLGNGAGVYRVMNGALRNATNPERGNTIGALVGFDDALLSLHYPGIEKPTPLEKKPAIPYIV
jgi:hypothetical protein